LISRALVLSEVADDSALKIDSRRIGPARVFERLWEALRRAHVRLLRLFSKLALERAVFLGRTPFAPRCIKDLVEERLSRIGAILFTRRNLVFTDTTSLYFEGAGGQTLDGYSKGHRPGQIYPRGGHRRLTGGL
jgi:hypothetical protein